MQLVCQGRDLIEGLSWMSPVLEPARFPVANYLCFLANGLRYYVEASLFVGNFHTMSSHPIMGYLPHLICVALDIVGAYGGQAGPA